VGSAGGCAFEEDGGCMELKAGYKQTEVGVIPEDWEVSTVGQEFSVQLGKMLDAEKNTGVPKPYLGNRSVQWDRIDANNLQTMLMSPSDIMKFRLRRGDLLVCEGGDVGRSAIWQAPIEECYYQKALHRLRPLHHFDPRLMVAILRRYSDQGFLSNYVTQTSIAHFPREKLLELPIPNPSKQEQTAIASALSDMDALLDGLDRLITKKRNLKQAAMQQLLTGKTRLAGFGEGKGMKSSELGEIPEDWDAGFLLDIASLIHGKAHEQYIVEDGDFEVVNSKFISTEGSVIKYASKNFCGAIENDVLMVLSDLPNGKALAKCFFVETSCKYAVNQRVCIYRVKNHDSKFLFYLLNRNKYFLSLDDGVTQTHILNGDIERCMIVLPTQKEEQKAIAAVLSDMDAEIAALEQRRTKTRDIKQGMMQELLTGRTRLV
jgi:type I restriction enzyme S subunit